MKQNRRTTNVRLPGIMIFLFPLMRSVFIPPCFLQGAQAAILELGSEVFTAGGAEMAGQRREIPRDHVGSCDWWVAATRRVQVGVPAVNHSVAVFPRNDTDKRRSQEPPRNVVMTHRAVLRCISMAILQLCFYYLYSKACVLTRIK